MVFTCHATHVFFQGKHMTDSMFAFAVPVALLCRDKRFWACAICVIMA